MLHFSEFEEGFEILFPTLFWFSLLTKFDSCC